MQDLIESLVAKLGIDKSIAEKATGVAIAFLKDKLDDTVFGQLLEKLPGAGNLVGKAEEASSGGGGGLLGSMLGAASSAIGGEAGDALELTSKLKGSGLDLSKFGDFGSIVTDYIKDQAGDELFGKVLSSVPELAKLAGK